MTDSDEGERAAGEALATVWTRDGATKIPVDPIIIARQLGLKVFATDLDLDTDATLEKLDGEDAARISINRRHPSTRQRFSCAHELGHWYLRVGRGDTEFAFVDRRDPRSAWGSKPEEVYANSFAAALLMPADLVKSQRDAGLTTVPALAYTFGVSPEAMKNRLSRLRLPVGA